MHFSSQVQNDSTYARHHLLNAIEICILPASPSIEYDRNSDLTGCAIYGLRQTFRYAPGAETLLVQLRMSANIKKHLASMIFIQSF